MSLIDGFYPGSKTPRQAPIFVDREVSDEPWDADPIIRTVRGKEMEFFSIGALAKCLGRSIVGIRLWERKGRIPTAPYRMPDHAGGKGDRLYTREIIEATYHEFAIRGLIAPVGMEPPRVRWAKQHADLTARLVEVWSTLVEQQKHA